MIEDRDLDAAVAAGVIDSATRDRLVQFVRDHRRGAAGPDEESFRLLTGFNDIFVTIAIGLVLFAIASLGGSVAPVIGSALVALASWGLAEYFTRQRRMALPSIVLLLTFVGSVGAVGAALFVHGGIDSPAVAPDGGPLRQGFGVIAAAAMAVVAAFAHWRRFMVPITVAAGAAAAGVMVFAAAATVLPDRGGAPLLLVVLLLGVIAFALAMHFDARDRARVTRWSDVAFWLHLLAAPAIIHPVFALTGLLGRNAEPGAAALVVLVYAVLTVVALAIDRRALLVSALAYVIYAIQALIERGGGITASFGLTALVIGGFLVLLSAAWRPIRGRVIALLPHGITARLPVAT